LARRKLKKIQDAADHSDMKLNRTKSTCAFCLRVRIFVLGLIFLSAVPMLNVELTVIQGVSLTQIAADLIMVSLAILVIWKRNKEYWRPRNDSTIKRP
jgi:hypothetical protein